MGNEHRWPTALVDMDGTLCDFDGAIVRDMTALLRPGERLSLDETNQLNFDRLRSIKLRPRWWFNLARIEQGFRTLDMLRSLKFKLHILTRGPRRLPNAWAEKLEWCLHHVPDAPTTITADKSRFQGELLVDDWPEYTDAWLDRHQHGLVILPDRHWNKDYRRPRVVRHMDTPTGDKLVLRHLRKLRSTWYE